MCKSVSSTRTGVCVSDCSQVLIHAFIHSLKGSPVVVTTTDDDGKQYSDGQWHEITAIRHQAFGRITLDGQYSGEQPSGPDAARLLS